MNTHRWSVVLLGLLPWLPALSHAAPPLMVEPAAGASLQVMQVAPTDSGWAVRGRLRLAPQALPPPDPGRVQVEARGPGGRVLAVADAPLYRVVTADRRTRLYGFRGTLRGDFPAGAELRVRRVPSSPR